MTKNSANPVYNSLNYGQNCRQYKLWIKLLVTKRKLDKYICFDFTKDEGTKFK